VRQLPAPDPFTSFDGLALFLDLDGTLAPIAPRPADVGSDPARNALLKSLAALLEGRLAIVSGRATSDVDRILDGAVAAVAGLHGLERRSANGTLYRAKATAGLDEARSALSKLVFDVPNLLVEDKGVTLALHYRANPAAENDVLAWAARWSSKTGLAVQRGSMVVELRPPGHDKGDAILQYLAEEPFAGAKPVFVGDDLTDEHGLAVVEKCGGLGVLVGPPRQTAASHRLADTEAVLAWLAKASRG
jgi:trehalose 6-phosphate phosphatase